MNSTKKAWLEYIKQEYPKSKIKLLDEERRIIIIDNKMFRYQLLRSNNHLEVSLKPLCMRSKKGRMLNKRLFLLCAAVALLAFTNKKDKISINENIEYEETQDVANEIISPIVATQAPIIIQVDPSQKMVKEEDVSEPEIKAIEAKITFTNEVYPTDELGFQKKAETKSLFGSSISNYSNRYGIDENLLVSLFTQERSNDKTSPNYNNVGQLTGSICGEKIEVPVYQDGILVKTDKLYVLPSCYDKYPISDLETMTHFPNFTSEEQQKIQEAVKLKNEGYEIFRLKDAKNNVDTNIRISTAYLSYLIQMKKDLIKGIASYNMGYPRIHAGISQEDILNGSILEANDPNYILNIFQYFTDDDWQKGIDVFIQGNLYHYNLERTYLDNLKR